ncbi:MAG TPA: lytic transglycosylase domain-containing protein, partial [Magnetospirillaceae bacterium]|nr:lytic transglycosylase domain-containing protein [Magnetospirillaceae bacterium]
MIRLFCVVLLWAAAGFAAAAELSAGDEAIYRSAFDLAKLHQFDAALVAGAAADDKRLLKVLEWQYYDTANSGADFQKIIDFIRDNPDWPLLGLLRRRAEEAVTPLTPPPAVLAWFDKNPPLTVPGKMAYADLLLGQGRKELAIQLLRKSWVGGNFDEEQEKTFLAKFGDLLSKEDEGPRLDRLLWEHQDGAATRQIQRVDPDLQLLAKARMALHAGMSDAEAVAGRVSEKLRDDPGLIYEWIRYRRGHDNYDGAIQLLRLPAHDKGPADLWWTERSLLVRGLLQKGDISVAYDIAQNHGLVSGGDFAEAEWLSGWIALRFLKDAEQGLGHFTRLYDHVSLPQSRSRAAYWAGRACLELGRGDDAANWFTLAARNPTTFHGQLAAGRLRPEALPPLPSDPQPTD